MPKLTSFAQQLGECIGRGQFGSVYRALNLNTGQVVAVKRISLEGKSETEVAELSNEVKLLKALAHPAVVKYEGLVRTEHYLNIILECAWANLYPSRFTHTPLPQIRRGRLARKDHQAVRTASRVSRRRLRPQDA